MSDYLLASAQAGHFWAVDAENGEDYHRIYDRATHQYIGTSPSEYAAAMRDSVHWGETPEANIWARLNQTNVIILIRTVQIDELDSTRPPATHTNMMVYRAREPDEPNIYGDPEAVSGSNSFSAACFYHSH